jgi:5-methylcytosine-specific restriction endonuclease McrA
MITFTLGIDYGASYVGIALVRNIGKGNEPLFAGTMHLDARALKDKVEPRAATRRLRRTRKTKKQRLAKLKTSLLSTELDEHTVSEIVRFAKRRGYKSLFPEKESTEKKAETELTYRYTREEFFQALECELGRLIPAVETRQAALLACKKILNLDGNRENEIREIKIDNRGVSRCAWEDCDNVTPRRINATLDALRQQLVTYFQPALKETPQAIGNIDVGALKLDQTSRKIRAAVDCQNDEVLKKLRKSARTILRDLRKELVSPENFDELSNKKWGHVEKSLMNLIENGFGRNSYCRKHSLEYVNFVVAGKKVPFKQSISESDILSRREQIAFSKLWRYIEARVLPLAPTGIDRIVVERTAFDLLAGNRKKINKTSDERIEDIYQLGPMYGFDGNRQAMLREEYGGLCAYCGGPSDKLIESEHILPRSQFFFDSYLNILPACPTCNAQKGKRLPGPASLHISQVAYEKFDEYLRKISATRPLHVLHYEKKGILNLMRDPNRAWDVDRYLSLIANSFANIVQSQRGPRPFARYLYSKISLKQPKKPRIEFCSGRHTALYRTIAYPGYSKYEDKSAENPSNHALDATILASQMPSITLLEGRGINVHAIGSWRRKVQSLAPGAKPDGIPVLPASDRFVDGFETVDENGYVTVEMRAMNWNQKDSATHKQDPYGWSESAKMPTKRKAAVQLHEDLLQLDDVNSVQRWIDRINNPSLRSAMVKASGSSPVGPAVAEAMKKWLRQSVANSLGHSKFSEHPADVKRRQELESFAHNKDASIPVTIGVKLLDTGVPGKIDFRRKDRMTGAVGQHYTTQPSNRGMVLAYPRNKDGKPDFAQPCIAGVRQNYALKTEIRSEPRARVRIFLSKPASLENGIIIGAGKFEHGLWLTELEKYLCDCGFHSYCLLTPCCVVCYQDGTSLFIRNFEKGFNKGGILNNVVGLRKNPFSETIIPLKTLTSNM